MTYVITSSGGVYTSRKTDISAVYT